MPPRRFLTTCTTALPETGGTRGDEPGRLHQGQHRQTSRGGPRAPPPRNLNQPGIAAENRPSEGRRRAASAESDDVGAWAIRRPYASSLSAAGAPRLLEAPRLGAGLDDVVVKRSRSSRPFLAVCVCAMAVVCPRRAHSP